LHDKSAELAELITRESGKPLRYARAEVTRAVLTFTLGAGESRRIGGEVLPIDQLPGTEGRLCLYERVPRGPIAAIRALQFSAQLGRAQGLARAGRGRANGLETAAAEPAHRSLRSANG